MIIRKISDHYINLIVHYENSGFGKGELGYHGYIHNTESSVEFVEVTSITTFWETTWKSPHVGLHLGSHTN